MLEELSVIESIWGESFVSLQGGGRPSFRVALSPTGSHVTCAITIVLPKRYPDTTVPLSFSLSSSTLDDEQTARLSERVNAVVTAKCVTKTGYLFETLMTAKDELELLAAGSSAVSSFEAMAERQSLLAETQMQERARALASMLEEEAKQAAELRDRAGADRHRTSESALVGPTPVAPQLSAAALAASPAGTGDMLASTSDGANSADHDGPLADALSPSSASRFRSDFKELGVLGKGGFGRVVKVRNLVDGMIYAVKLIVLSADEADNRKLIREVHTLSRLHHRHVVRYFQAWIERGDDACLSDDSEGVDSYNNEEGTAPPVEPAAPAAPLTTDSSAEKGPVPTGTTVALPPVPSSVPAQLFDGDVVDSESDWIGLETSHSVRLRTSALRSKKASTKVLRKPAAKAKMPPEPPVSAHVGTTEGASSSSSKSDDESASSSWGDDSSTSSSSEVRDRARSYGDVGLDYFGGGGLDLAALMQPALPRPRERPAPARGDKPPVAVAAGAAGDASSSTDNYVPRVLYIQVCDSYTEAMLSL